ncbi:MAG: alpha/beta hydrolase [Pseudomonadota bacterium]
MALFSITDWDDAYANGPNIPAGDTFPPRWQADAAAFRAAHTVEADIPYGDRPRQKFDLLRPAGAPRGLLVFVHGGFWMRCDRTWFTHFAAGPLARGMAVALPSYTLAPEARISEITREVGAAVTMAASHVAGPIILAGHSAGGHLVTRQVCTDGPLGEDIAARIAQVVSISGLHDLRPLLRLKMNETFQMDAAEAADESAALKHPREDVHVVCYVGGTERQEFLRQNALLANIWTGLGAKIEEITEPDRHHFDVLDGLRHAEHPLTTFVSLG